MQQRESQSKNFSESLGKWLELANSQVHDHAAAAANFTKQLLSFFAMGLSGFPRHLYDG